MQIVEEVARLAVRLMVATTATGSRRTRAGQPSKPQEPRAGLSLPESGEGTYVEHQVRVAVEKLSVRAGRNRHHLQRAPRSRQSRLWAKAAVFPFLGRWVWGKRKEGRGEARVRHLEVLHAPDEEAGFLAHLLPLK